MKALKILLKEGALTSEISTYLKKTRRGYELKLGYQIKDLYDFEEEDKKIKSELKKLTTKLQKAGINTEIKKGDYVGIMIFDSLIEKEFFIKNIKNNKVYFVTKSFYRSTRYAKGGRSPIATKIGNGRWVFDIIGEIIKK